MYQKVKAYMKEHGMVVDGDVVLAGVSGGGDSMAMLEMFRRAWVSFPAARTSFSSCSSILKYSEPFSSGFHQRSGAPP